MAITIPETMPVDWLKAGAEARGCEPDDPDLKRHMEAAYRTMLRPIVEAALSLKADCLFAARHPDKHILPSMGGPANHHLTAEPVEASASVASTADQDGMAV